MIRQQKVHFKVQSVKKFKHQFIVENLLKHFLTASEASVRCNLLSSQMAHRLSTQHLHFYKNDNDVSKNLISDFFPNNNHQ